MKMVQHRFVEFMPMELEEGILYISMEYCTAIHLCVCGCGNKVITPLAPTSWQLSFDGRAVTLSPSIGNWNFDCQSHYWIINNEVVYSGKWNRREIRKGRAVDEKLKKEYYNQVQPDREGDVIITQKPGLIKRLINFFSGFNKISYWKWLKYPW